MSKINVIAWRFRIQVQLNPYVPLKKSRKFLSFASVDRVLLNVECAADYMK